MKTKYSLQAALICVLSYSTSLFSQTPQANFSISPNPVCAGSVVHVTDLSTNAPTAWAYTLHIGVVGSLTSSVQNPTVAYNAVGVQTITLVATNGFGSSIPVTQTLLVLPSPNITLMPNNASSCIGGSGATLSAMSNSNNTLSWSNGANNSSIVVSPTASTVYSCTATNTAGCSKTSTIAVTIAQPTVNIFGNPGASCNGSSVTLISNITGQGPYTYSWSTSATTKTISTNILGVYDVTVTNGAGCSGTHSFTVNATTSLNVIAQSNQTLICAGFNANLSANGATSYSWSNGSNMQLITVTPSTTTAYTVTGVSGSCTGSAVITITVHNTPTIVITCTPNPVCIGSTATITANGATTYSWNNGGSSAQIVVNPLTNTVYVVHGVNQGCPQRTATVSLGVQPLPIVTASVNTNDTICAGEAIILSAGGATSYFWNTGATTASFTDMPAMTTSYEVTGTNAFGCVNSATVMQEVWNCTGLISLQTTNNRLMIYPNPNNGSFVINSIDAMTLNIINETGQVVKTLVLNSNTNYKADVSNLPSGIYFVFEQYSTGNLRQKIVVQ